MSGVLMDHQPHLQTVMGLWYILTVLINKFGILDILVSFLSIWDIMCTMLHNWFISWFSWSRPSCPWPCCLWMQVAKELMHRKPDHLLLLRTPKMDQWLNGRMVEEEHWSLDGKKDSQDLFGMAYQEYMGAEHRGTSDHTYGRIILAYGGYREMDDCVKWGLSNHNQGDPTIEERQRCEHINQRGKGTTAVRGFLAPLTWARQFLYKGVRCNNMKTHVWRDGRETTFLGN